MDIYKEDAYLFLAEVNIGETLARLYAQHKANEEEIAKLGTASPKKARRLNDIKNALNADFEGYEKMHLTFKNSGLNFGNDVEYDGKNARTFYVEQQEKIPNSVLIHPGVSKMSIQKGMIKTISLSQL